VLAADEDECGQLSVEDWLFGVDDFGVVVDGLVVEGVVVVGAELFVVAELVVGFAGVELWVAAIAAPLPAVRASARDANRTVRLGLRIAPLSFACRDTRPWKRYAMSLA
jgi:hypothetical protein